MLKRLFISLVALFCFANIDAVTVKHVPATLGVGGSYTMTELGKLSSGETLYAAWEGEGITYSTIYVDETQLKYTGARTWVGSPNASAGKDYEFKTSGGSYVSSASPSCYNTYVFIRLSDDLTANLCYAKPASTGEFFLDGTSVTLAPNITEIQDIISTYNNSDDCYHIPFTWTLTGVDKVVSNLTIQRSLDGGEFVNVYSYDYETLNRFSNGPQTGIYTVAVPTSAKSVKLRAVVTPLKGLESTLNGGTLTGNSEELSLTLPFQRMTLKVNSNTEQILGSFNKVTKLYTVPITWTSSDGMNKIIENYTIMRYLNGNEEGEVVYTRNFTVNEDGLTVDAVNEDSFNDELPANAISVRYVVAAKVYDTFNNLITNKVYAEDAVLLPTSNISVTSAQGYLEPSEGTFQSALTWEVENMTDNVVGYKIYAIVDPLATCETCDANVSKSTKARVIGDWGENVLVATINDAKVTSYSDYFTDTRLIGKNLLATYHVEIIYADEEYIPTISDCMAEVVITPKSPAGVAKVVSDANDKPASIVTLDGVVVKRNASADDIKSLPSGVYIINGIKIIKK